MFSSSKWIFKAINTQIVTIITIIFLFLLLRLFQDLLSSSSCNTNMCTFTILTNPVAIRPKTKHACRKMVLTNSSLLPTHSSLTHPGAPSVLSSPFIMHTIIFFSYPFTPLNVSTSPSLTLSFALPYYSHSLSPICLQR